MAYRYRNHLKKVFLSDEELNTLNRLIAKSGCSTFSDYARLVLLNPTEKFITIQDNSFSDLVMQLKRIGNNINQIAHHVNQSHLISKDDVDRLHEAVKELITEVEKQYTLKLEKLRSYYGHH
ncbi:MobC family plasmid mobilization relaxosome protein [Streptococcus loxodontisalivarius]|uniref:Bacterial mobilisation domain-containing protein n=1 Tax=Streptococcus loxodontisalivarius TaxID=1349415 RepID=A0ABS2PPV1_9STRE|nr:MobC family plasmid mobilization relaxosome protein [Streptococcus loxodontisalivarius]MBM7642062.1 hypothetical protein [Streptococcus loxodontisalivarius]